MVLVSLFVSAGLVGAVEHLYNGIVLPDEWPPNYGKSTSEPVPVPYLDNRPAVVPIDVGRQLFVDDFLVERTTLKRIFHQPSYHPANPILKPGKEEWSRIFATVFSGGVWHDPQDKLFKIWYMCGNDYGLAYATSRDGINWTLPNLDVVAGTNLVWYPGHVKNQDPKNPTLAITSNSVWLDHYETDPNRRFKMLAGEGRKHKAFGTPNRPIAMYFSPDGIKWSQPHYISMYEKERSTIYYNPFRERWVFNMKGVRDRDGKIHPVSKWAEISKLGNPLDRARMYRETRREDIASQLTDGQMIPMMGADRLDIYRNTGTGKPQIYNLDCVAYESLILGMFSIFHLDGDGSPGSRKHHNDISLGYSRDGFHWYRPDRRAFIAPSHDELNLSNFQSACGCCLTVGDKLYFYYSTRDYTPQKQGKPQFSTTCLATLRRDGFCSMSSVDKAGEDTLTTRPVTFRGKYMFVNVDADGGELLVEALDKDGKVIQPFTHNNCVPVRVDKTVARVSWNGVDDLSALAGKTGKFKFYLTKGDLYAFWVTPDKSGASHGYVAAGGPGYTGPTDTVGKAVFK